MKQKGTTYIKETSAVDELQGLERERVIMMYTLYNILYNMHYSSSSCIHTGCSHLLFRVPTHALI